MERHGFGRCAAPPVSIGKIRSTECLSSASNTDRSFDARSWITPDVTELTLKEKAADQRLASDDEMGVFAVFTSKIFPEVICAAANSHGGHGL